MKTIAEQTAYDKHNADLRGSPTMTTPTQPSAKAQTPHYSFVGGKLNEQVNLLGIDTRKVPARLAYHAIDLLTTLEESSERLLKCVYLINTITSGPHADEVADLARTQIARNKKALDATLAPR